MVGSILVSALLAHSSVGSVSPETVDVAKQRQLFVDDCIIGSMKNVRLVQHEPRYEGIVFRFDKPWEGAFCGYTTVIKDGGTFRLYYRGLPEASGPGSIQSLCYAESADGLNWSRPNLRIVEVQGKADNNVIITANEAGTHSFSAFIDTKPGVPADQRYKGLGHDGDALAGFVSADGVHWRRIQKDPVLRNDTGHFAFDSQNVAFWSVSEGCYVAYFRTWRDNVRRISRATSPDFIHWSYSTFMDYRHDGKPAPVEHMYTNQTHPYFRAPQIYVSTAARFMPGRQVLTDEQAKGLKVNPSYFKDTSDVVLMTTRGGNVYDRTFLESFIRPGLGLANWVSRSNYPALGIVQTGPTEMSIYVNRDYAQPTAHLARYSMRLDGFASVCARYEGGELVTKPFRLEGSKLYLNFSTSAAGGICVEILGDDGKPIQGYSADDCSEIIGDEIGRAVRWKGGDDLSPLNDRRICLRFVMKDADLYSLRFR